MQGFAEDPAVGALTLTLPLPLPLTLTLTLSLTLTLPLTLPQALIAQRVYQGLWRIVQHEGPRPHRVPPPKHFDPSTLRVTLVCNGVSMVTPSTSWATTTRRAGLGFRGRGRVRVRVRVRVTQPEP